MIRSAGFKLDERKAKRTVTIISFIENATKLLQFMVKICYNIKDIIIEEYKMLKHFA